MTTDEKIKIVEKLIGEYTKLSAVFDRLDDVLGSDPSAPLFNAVWSSFDSYTDTVSRLIGDPTHYLSWYIYDNQLGEKKFSVRWDSYDKNNRKRKHSRIVKTVKDLVYVIEKIPQ